MLSHTRMGGVPDLETKISWSYLSTTKVITFGRHS